PRNRDFRAGGRNADNGHQSLERLPILGDLRQEHVREECTEGVACVLPSDTTSELEAESRPCEVIVEVDRKQAVIHFRDGLQVARGETGRARAARTRESGVATGTP